ncbi:Pre-mRNA-splicing factor syf2 [Phytophthora palmivora]|uniref:Pre-mRNA-splicing factor SYF2 n=1 Tax=Phytophthora palmivora TaxID=4796 RepID=A0A2P4Y6E0_9STRA|nr:Pre-mRNA-splicing factor syf2 [Phytophthora palmivora]
MADADEVTAMTPAQKKLFELRMKMNAGRKANKQEVAAEHDRVKNNDKKAKKEEQFKKREEKKLVAASGKTHLNETAEVAEMKAKKANKKEKRKAAFGWDVFNQDSLYKGYKKRLVNLPTSGETAAAVTATREDALDDELAYGKDNEVEEANVERMAQELEERIKARKKFSRRRQHYEGEDVDYINGQNRIFNRKASQAFDKYTVEIRQNLERGTAL